MATLRKLAISKLRNISTADFRPGNNINIFYGENGSGKSSVLEAVYILGLARSFRGGAQKPLIQYDEKECTLYTELDDGLSLGLTKASRGGQLVKISGRKALNTAELARCLPLQLLNSDTFKILEGSPKVRRHYLDWGVFHVEHQFIDQWRQAQRALKNRNNLLKSKASPDEIEPWTVEFVRHSEEMDRYRAAYIEKLLPILLDILQRILPLEDMSLEYERGWENGVGLQEVLSNNFLKDMRYGYTVAGPQRADLKIKLGQNYAVDVLSRGQQKLLVSALKISQGCLLENEGQKKCIYLVDDLPSELDRGNRKKVCLLLEELDCQVFITTVERDSLDDCWQPSSGSQANEKKLFHVKHGKITEIN